MLNLRVFVDQNRGLLRFKSTTCNILYTNEQNVYGVYCTNPYCRGGLLPMYVDDGCLIPHIPRFYLQHFVDRCSVLSPRSRQGRKEVSTILEGNNTFQSRYTYYQLPGQVVISTLATTTLVAPA
jgi:hypothetical protein